MNSFIGQAALFYQTKREGAKNAKREKNKRAAKQQVLNLRFFVSLRFNAVPIIAW
jgi:hypothetical protein